MITINRFQLSADMTQLFVDVSASAGKIINKFTIATEQTYDDSVLDLTSKLSQLSENESITLVPSDLNLSSFNGIYIGEFTSEITPENNEVKTASACNITQFFYCLNDKLTSVNSDCLGCDENLNNAMIIDLYLEALKMALITEKYRNAIINFYSLNRLCCGNVDACLSGCTSGYGILDDNFILA